MMPGILAWGTLALLVLLSWLTPIWIAFFIIAFDVYWLLKTIYLSLHLRSDSKSPSEYKNQLAGKIGAGESRVEGILPSDYSANV